MIKNPRWEWIENLYLNVQRFHADSWRCRAVPRHCYCALLLSQQELCNLSVGFLFVSKFIQCMDGLFKILPSSWDVFGVRRSRAYLPSLSKVGNFNHFRAVTEDILRLEIAVKKAWIMVEIFCKLSTARTGRWLYSLYSENSISKVNLNLP